MKSPFLELLGEFHRVEKEAANLRKLHTQTTGIAHDALDECEKLKEKVSNLQSLADRQGVLLDEADAKLNKSFMMPSNWDILSAGSPEALVALAQRAAKQAEGFKALMQGNGLNVCRLAAAALSHLDRLPHVTAVAKENQHHIAAAVELLKPLACGVHDTYPNDEHDDKDLWPFYNVEPDERVLKRYDINRMTPNGATLMSWVAAKVEHTIEQEELKKFWPGIDE